MAKFNIKTFQGMILALQDYWAKQGCTVVQPFDMEVGAGTSHPMTALRLLMCSRPVARLTVVTVKTRTVCNIITNSKW